MPVAVGPNEVKAREEDLEGRAAMDEGGGMVGAILDGGTEREEECEEEKCGEVGGKRHHHVVLDDQSWHCNCSSRRIASTFRFLEFWV